MLICQLVLYCPSFIFLNLLHTFIRLSLETVPMSKIPFPVKTRIGFSFPLIPGLIPFQRCPWRPHTFLADTQPYPPSLPPSAWFLLPSTTPPTLSPCFSGPDHFSCSPFTLRRSQSLQKRSLRTPQSVPHISSFSCVWSQPPSQHFHSTATPPWVWEVVAFHEFEISPVADFLSSNKPLKRAVRSCGLQALTALLVPDTGTTSTFGVCPWVKFRLSLKSCPLGKEVGLRWRHHWEDGLCCRWPGEAIKPGLRHPAKTSRGGQIPGTPWRLSWSQRVCQACQSSCRDRWVCGLHAQPRVYL